MRILVTGATGFIGSRLLARLAVECDELRVLRRAGSSLGSIKNIKFEDFIGDVRNRDDAMRAVEGCDVVFHLAASVSYWDALNKEQYDINVEGTKNIVEACVEHGVKRLIYTSSIVAVGMSIGNELADENTPYNLAPLNISYCDTKHLAELEVQKGIERGLDAVIVNPGAVFGAGDMRRYQGQLFGSKVWTRAFYSGGGIATVDVDDVVEGHFRAWKKGKKGERYLLVNENLTFKEICAKISEIMKACPPRVRIPTWFVFSLAHILTAFSKLTGGKPSVTIPMAKFTRVNLFFSNEKAKKELGMTFRPFIETVERAVEWLRNKGPSYTSSGA